MKFNSENYQSVVENLPIPTELFDRWGACAVVSGTFMFCTYGLMKEFGDVDIIVNAKCAKCMDELMEYGHKNGMTVEESDQEYLSLKIENNGITYNVLFSDEYTYAPLLYLDEKKDYGLDTVKNALRIKMALKRGKDYMHLTEMIQVFSKYHAI